MTSGQPLDALRQLAGCTPQEQARILRKLTMPEMRFALVKHYDGIVRRITRPTPGTVTVFVNGVATSAFTLEPGGQVAFDAPPATGAVVTASFDFDVPVRFAEDRLAVKRATFLAGEAPSVPLIEVREA